MLTGIYAAAKASLGITNDKKDDEITLAVDDALHSLDMIGVGNVDAADPTTAQAVMLYVRFWFNYQGDADRYQRAFKQKANAMAHAREYGGLDG